MACFSIERQEMSDLKGRGARARWWAEHWPLAILILALALTFAWVVALAYGGYRLLEWALN